MARAMSWLPLLQLACVPGCQSDCESVACPNLETAVQRQSVSVPLAPGTVARLTLQDESGTVLLGGGELQFSVNPPACLVGVGSECQVTLEGLRLELTSFTIETNLGTIAMEDATLRLHEPVRLESSASGYLLPADSLVHTCGSVDGRDDHGVAQLRESPRLRLDSSRQALALDGEFPVVLHAGDGSCEQLEGRLTLVATGDQWIDHAPGTGAGASKTDAGAPPR